MKLLRRVAVARWSRREICNGMEAKSAMHCREQILTLADYTCRSQTTSDLSEASGIGPSKTAEFGSLAPLASSSLPSIPLGTAVSTGLNCNGSDDKLRSVIYYAPFPQASSSTLDLPDGVHQPQSSLVLMTGESSLGSHNFSNQFHRNSPVEAEARAIRLQGGAVRSIELPLITESMK